MLTAALYLWGCFPLAAFYSVVGAPQQISYGLFLRAGAGTSLCGLALTPTALAKLLRLRDVPTLLDAIPNSTCFLLPASSQRPPDLFCSYSP